MCDSFQDADPEEWEQACAQENQNNTASDSPDDRADEKLSWFICETRDMNTGNISSDISSSAPQFQLEVSVELQLSDAETLNLTLFGRSSHNSLRLRPLDEEEEETGDDEGQKEAFFCCRPLLPSSESSNQSRCLLWLTNQTVLTATAKEKLPWKRTQKDEWKCQFRVVWLVLLCVVLLAIVTLVVKQVYRGKRLFRKSQLHPGGFNASPQLNDVQGQIETIAPRGAALHSFEFQSWSGLSPIQEVENQNDMETLLDGNVNHCYTGNLHHRSHSSLPSLTEEQPR
ncbi:uncharacterized protein LOC115391035 isoform X2 [Salarias fasciatus]|nr:uncharacterized protein LOC115391035 isoform X2 [Salarias fasciatus]